jgi:hypothetical protein
VFCRYILCIYSSLQEPGFVTRKLGLDEMREVRTWRVKFDRIQKAKSLPNVRSLDNIIKYENSLERSIFRNLAALKALQENRAGRGQPKEDILELPVCS